MTESRWQFFGATSWPLADEEAVLVPYHMAEKRCCNLRIQPGIHQHLLSLVAVLLISTWLADGLPSNAAQAPQNPAIAVEITDRTGKQLTFGTFVDQLMAKQLVCVGERHDSALDHLAQLQIIKAIYARDESLGVGMEIFQTPFQAAIDTYLSGESNEETLLHETEYESRWGQDWKLYRPIVDFCRRNRIPVAALNARKELTSKISKVGFDALAEQEKTELGPIDFNLKEHREHWFDLLGEMHGSRKTSSEQKERSYQVMAVWDDYMARTAAEFKFKKNLNRVVILAGSGHIDGGFGIPSRAARYAKAAVATVRISTENESKQSEHLPTDYVVLVSLQDVLK